MLVLEGRGKLVRGAGVSMKGLMTHACGHLKCKVMLCEVIQMHRATG